MVDPPESAAARTAVLSVYPPVRRADVPGLCARLQDLLAADPTNPFPCDVGALVMPDLATIEALARLQLTARRAGRGIRLLDVCGELRDLLALTGLDGILADPVGTGCGFGSPSALERRRQTEQREQLWDVEERVDPHDPPV